MVGVFLAFVIHKARNEFSRTVEQAKNDTLLQGQAPAAAESLSTLIWSWFRFSGF